MGDVSFSFVMLRPLAREGDRCPDSRELQQIREEITSCYLRHRDAVFRFLLVNTRNPAEAEDVTHDAFLRLYLHYVAGDAVESPLPWLLTVARNIMIDRTRHLRREAPQQESVWVRLIRTCRDSTPSVESVLMTNDRCAAMERALHQLHGPERIAWLCGSRASLFARSPTLWIYRCGPP